MQKLTGEYVKQCTLNDLLGQKFICTCGKTHDIAMKKAVIKSGALAELGNVLKDAGYQKALLISDALTWDIAASKAADSLHKANVTFSPLILQGRVLPDEQRVGEIMIHATLDTDVIITVGTGVITDLGKFVASKMKIALAAVVTAPSVDGFASHHAALVIGSLKISYDAMCPTYLFGDVDILKQAPLSMILAGWCDVIGKYSALSDWKLAHIIAEEPYCEVVAMLMLRAVDTCRKNLPKLKEREANAVQALMEALVLAGVAMSFVGNSRPASGSEHHLSHCWEMKALDDGVRLPPHGVQVGVGEMLMATLYDWLLHDDINLAKAQAHAQNFDFETWKVQVENYFGKDAQGLLKEIQADGRYGKNKRRMRLQNIKVHCKEILEVLQQMPKAKDVEELLNEAKTAKWPQDIGLTVQMAVNSIRMAKEVRPKYTLLGLLDDLGILGNYASRMEKVLIMKATK